MMAKRRDEPKALQNEKKKKIGNQAIFKVKVP
jgi:hypothetical protein